MIKTMIDLQKLKKEQKELSKKIITTDSFDKLETVAGCEQLYHNETIVSTIAVFDYKTLKLLEVQQQVMETDINYIPGFLAYREAPAITEAYNKLEIKPAVMLLSGHGIAHPRRLGIASHIGLLLNQATIGVAKKVLYGSVNDGKIIIDKEVVGALLKTKEHAKPIIVSPGHKICLKTSIEIIKKCQKQHKLPEPMHIAHKQGNKIKQKLKKEDPDS